MAPNSPPTTSDGSKYAVESMPIASPGEDHPAAEAFPSIGNPPSPKNTTRRLSFDTQSPNVLSLQGRLRSASKNFQESNPPTGRFQLLSVDSCIQVQSWVLRAEMNLSRASKRVLSPFELVDICGICVELCQTDYGSLFRNVDSHWSNRVFNAFVV